MKTDAVFRANASCDVYVPKVEFDAAADADVVSYDFYARLPGFAVPGAGGIYFTTRVALKPLSRISGLTDEYGVSLSPHRFMYINDATPQLDFTGRVIAWKYTLKTTLPRDVVAQVQALDDFADSPFVDTSLGHPE